MIAFEKAEILQMGISFETDEEMTQFLTVLTEELQRRIEEKRADLAEQNQLSYFSEDTYDEEIEDFSEICIEDYEETYCRCKSVLRAEILRYRSQIAGRTPHCADKLLDVTIEELELSIRSFNCLKRVGIHTLGDILMHGDLSDIRNLGRRGVEEVTQKLREMGL
ncbi:MAG: hypothetical protein K5705_09830 [Oscillospiraceae bacterium]|jgi:DNA-directed RNA polymerase alpha subunit|nr:hypothetical protein [Oscillospiraceae bacterium]